MAGSLCFSFKEEIFEYLICEDDKCDCQVPVAEGSHVTLKGAPKTWVADFVHGADGFGNMNFEAVEVKSSLFNAVLINLIREGKLG